MHRDQLFLFALILLIPVISVLIQSAGAVEEKAPNTVDNSLRQNEKAGSKTDDEAVEREADTISADGFSVKERQQLEKTLQKHQFQAEVDRLMKIIINSLYSNTEIFLRELISNASDALDKIRFLGVADHKQLESGSTLEIKIKADPKAKTLTISDTGIGMTKEQMVANLGTIAKSGTTEFMENMRAAGTGGDVSQIGQFGVGFYSAFLVADTVTVISKSNDDPKQHVWTSDAHGSFTVGEDPRGNTLGRGTQIILHIKEDAENFLDEATLETLVTKYSEFITFPISLWKGVEEEREVPLTPEEIAEEQKKRDEAKKDQEEDEDAEEVDIDGGDKPAADEEPIPTTKKVKETVHRWEVMNSVKPIWTRTPKDVTDEEYNSFYQSFSKDTNDPIMHIHFLGEGEVDFKSLLYVPSKPPANLYDPNAENQHKGIKLYVKRVFITDEFKNILPKYLSFIKGVVDSDDLPLNVSREMLQEHKLLQVIRKKLVRKAIAMFQQLQEDDIEKYKTFHAAYGTTLKFGIIEDPHNRQRLSKLVMFQSSKTSDWTTLQGYVDRLKKDQTNIYYLAGESKEAVASSPLIERLVKRGYEVLYMTDPIDEYALANMGEKFDSKYKLVNIAREGAKVEGEEDADKDKAAKEEWKVLIDFLKTTLADKIDRVEVSKLLTKSPSALVSAQYGWTANMERIFKAQALADKNSQAAGFNPRKILQINPRHPIVKELQRRVETDAADSTARDISWLLYDTGALTSGFSLDDPASFSARIVRMMNLGLNLDVNAAAEDEPEPEPVAEQAKSEEDAEEDHQHDEL